MKTNKTILSEQEEINNISMIVGKFIMLASEIDYNITQIISTHFFKDDNHIELNQFVLSELSLNTKCIILGKLLKSRYLSIYNKYDGDKLLKDLSKFRTYRNKFAHSIISYNVDKNNKKDYTKLMVSTYSNLKIGKDVVSLKEHEIMFSFLKTQSQITNNIFQEISK